MRWSVWQMQKGEWSGREKRERLSITKIFFRKKLSFEEFGLRSRRVNLSQSHPPKCWERKKSGGACRICFDAAHPPTCNHCVTHIRLSVKKSESCCLLNLTISSHWPHYIPPLETTLIRSGCINRKWLSWDHENYIFQKVTKMGSITGQKTDYNGVGALRGQRHIPSKH